MTSSVLREGSLCERIEGVSVVPRMARFECSIVLETLICLGVLEQNVVISVDELHEYFTTLL